jgi:hypothetical protein
VSESQKKYEELKSEQGDCRSRSAKCVDRVDCLIHYCLYLWVDTFAANSKFEKIDHIRVDLEVTPR